MREKIKKIISKLPPNIRKHFEMVFSDSAENHLFLLRLGQKRFRSYTELKRHQKRVRTFVLIVCLALIMLLVGVVVGPALFPAPIEPQIYIPNGKGDIVLGNISKNQFTIIFKTLDGANGNKPLATKATVEVYSDPGYSNLERRSNEDDYAVTHIIPVDSLQEGKNYYVKIIAMDAATPTPHEKIISDWGGGTDPIKVFTVGDLVATNCSNVQNGKNPDSTSDNAATKLAENNESNESVNVSSANPKASLSITDVQNENHLQPDNRVQTIISWETNIPASTAISYGEKGTEQKTQLASTDAPALRHAVIMTTLKNDTAYYFTVTSKDEKGNWVTSDEYSLHTPQAQKNVVEKIKENFGELLNKVSPFNKQQK